MITTSEKDLFDFQNQNTIILLQANSLGYGATGLFKRLRIDYPEVFNDYHDYCVPFRDKRTQHETIGHFISSPLKNSTNRICFAFSQKFITDTKYEVDFEAWENILKKIHNAILKNEQNTGVLSEIHSPYKIGYGTNPEESEYMRQLVDQQFLQSKINFVWHI